MVAERRAPQEQTCEKICEQIVDVHVPQVVEQVLKVPKISSRDRILQGTVEQIFDVPVTEMAEQLVKLPNIVSQDRIQERTVQRIADIPVPPVVEELVDVFKLQIVEKIDETSEIQTVQEDSAVLAQLASRISAVMKFGAETGDGPLVKVKGSITESISRLVGETSSQASLKACCCVEMSAATEKGGSWSR